MPIVIFFPASVLPPTSELFIITALSPREDEGGFPINGDIVIGMHVSPLVSALNVDLTSVDITVDSVPAMVSGLSQDGYSVSTHIGLFDGHLAYIFIINPDTDLSSNYAVNVIASGDSSTSIATAIKDYDYFTGSKSAFRAYHQFGELSGRYRLLTTPLDSVQRIGDYIAITGQEFLSLGDLIIAAQEGILVQTTSSVAALSQFSEEELADLIEANQIHLDEALGNPTPSPTTLFGPSFASTVGSPHNKQIGAIKLQPDGYQ